MLNFVHPAKLARVSQFFGAGLIAISSGNSELKA